MPAANSTVETTMNQIVYLRSFLRSPGVMNAQIW